MGGSSAAKERARPPCSTQCRPDRWRSRDVDCLFQVLLGANLFNEMRAASQSPDGINFSLIEIRSINFPSFLFPPLQTIFISLSDTSRLGRHARAHKMAVFTQKASSFFFFVPKRVRKVPPFFLLAPFSFISVWQSFLENFLLPFPLTVICFSDNC